MHAFCRLLIFFKIIFFEKFFQEHYRVPNSLYPDQAPRFAGSGLGPNCLQRLSVDDSRRQIVKMKYKTSDILYTCRLSFTV